MANSGLAGVFAALSTAGSEYPNMLRSVESRDDRERLRQKEITDQLEKDKAKAAFEAVLKGLPALGVPNDPRGRDASALDTVDWALNNGGGNAQLPQGVGPGSASAGTSVAAGLPMQPVDGPNIFSMLKETPQPEVGALASVAGNPMAPPMTLDERLARGPETPLPQPKVTTYRDQHDYLMQHVTSPEDVATMKPYLDLLDEAAKAQESGDHVKAQAFAERAKEHMQGDLEVMRENRSDARNAATIAGENDREDRRNATELAKERLATAAKTKEKKHWDETYARGKALMDDAYTKMQALDAKRPDPAKNADLFGAWQKQYDSESKRHLTGLGQVEKASQNGGGPPDPAAPGQDPATPAPVLTKASSDADISAYLQKNGRVADANAIKTVRSRL